MSSLRLGIGTYMNRLCNAKRVQVLSMLREGASMRPISGVTGISLNTIAKLLVDAGRACAAFHDERVQGLMTERLQIDEIWSFTAASKKTFPA